MGSATFNFLFPPLLMLLYNMCFLHDMLRTWKGDVKLQVHYCLFAYIILVGVCVCGGGGGGGCATNHFVHLAHVSPPNIL